MATTLQKTLESYGLKERHAKIYLACLSLGSATIQSISRRSTFARSTCEAVLISLQQKGFVTSFKKKNARYFSAVDPRILIRTLKRKHEILEEALPQFLGTYNKGNVLPTSRFYAGKEGMHTVFEEILDEAEDLICYGSVEELYEVLGTAFPDFRQRRIKNKIPARVILKDTELARNRQQMGSKELREVRLVQNDLPSASTIFLWKNKMAMFSLQDDIMALVIESQDFHNIHRAMFDSLWEKLPAYRAH